MSTGGTHPYRITLIGEVPSEISRLARRASFLGKKKPYLDAWLAIEKRLSSNPSEYGEHRFRLLNGDLVFRTGAVQPVAIHFSVNEKHRVVFVLKVFLLGD